MTGITAAADAGLLTHGVHMSLVAFGITGLTAILLPQALERFRRDTAPPHDEHEVRVRDLQAQLADHQHRPPASQIATSVPSGDTFLTPFTHRDPTAITGATVMPWSSESRLLPFLLVAALASAGAHAAVAPPHLLDSVLFGAFFIVTAVAQLSWVLALLAGISHRMLLAAIWGNTLLLLLWATTRLWGLPFGLMPAPETLGPWDVMCAVWEVIIIGGALRLLRGDHDGLRPPPLFDWSPAATAWLGACAVILLLLAVSGAHS